MLVSMRFSQDLIDCLSSDDSLKKHTESTDVILWRDTRNLIEIQ